MFRFQIREVLWLTVVVALGVGWWIEFRQNAHLRRRCDRLASLAETSAKVMQAVGINAEFRDDNIHIGGYQFSSSRRPAVPLDMLEPLPPLSASKR